MYPTLVRELGSHARARAKRARAEVLVILPLFAAVIFAYQNRMELFGVDMPVRIICAVAPEWSRMRSPTRKGRALRSTVPAMRFPIVC
jgi:hypothetical protein